MVIASQLGNSCSLEIVGALGWSHLEQDWTRQSDMVTELGNYGRKCCMCGAFG